MIAFLDYMTFVCLTGVTIICTFLLMAGIFELINRFSKGKFKETIINFLEECDE